MNLLFDLRATQPNSTGKRHGGGRYGEVIFFRMEKLNLSFSCFYDSRLWLNPEVKSLIDEKKTPLYDCAEKSIQDIVDEYKFDRIFSCCTLTSDIANLSGCEVYVTVHDTRRFETNIDKGFWDYKNPFKAEIKFFIKSTFKKRYESYMLKKFRELHIDTGLKIITVSEHTGNAFKCFFPELKDADIPVYYSPNTSLNEGDNPHADIQHDNTELYFLAVSGNRWEKNNARAIKAFDKLVDYGLIKNVRMKVTGAKKDNFKFNVKHLEAFDFLGYVSDQELEQLYANAYLFVYPSLNEGFGYPPLEAMRYHVPVIASPFTSISTICDSGALYFNPYSVEEIMNRMLMMMDPERHAEFAERGYQQYLKIHERQVRDLDGVIDFIMKESEADRILDGGGRYKYLVFYLECRSNMYASDRRCA